jgi:hypothetical protein
MLTGYNFFVVFQVIAEYCASSCFCPWLPYSLRDFFSYLPIILASAYEGITSDPYGLSLLTFVTQLHAHIQKNSPGKLAIIDARVRKERVIAYAGACKDRAIADAMVHEERQRQRAVVLVAVKGTAPLAPQCICACQWICRWQQHRQREGPMDATLLCCCLHTNKLQASRRPGTRPGWWRMVVRPPRIIMIDLL